MVWKKANIPKSSLISAAKLVLLGLLISSMILILSFAVFVIIYLYTPK